MKRKEKERKNKSGIDIWGVFHKDPKVNLSLTWNYILWRAICSLKIKYIHKRNSSILDSL